MISIHAPSRERPFLSTAGPVHGYFNPRSLAGATISVAQALTIQQDFNPRSVAGATGKNEEETERKAVL